MPPLNFTFTTDELNLLVEEFLTRKSQPGVASFKVVGGSSSAATQNCDVAGESSSLETYMATYLNLPHHIKSCIDYCSFVTERYREDKKKLVRLLVAEGLIVQDNSGDVLENIALSIIEELISLGVLEKDPLHHEEVEVSSPFKQICNEGVEKKEFVADAANFSFRLCILDDRRDNLSPNLNTLPLKSLFVMTAERQGSCGINEGRLSRAYMGTICRLQSLEVLDLNGYIECLPDAIGDLVHLKYLSLYYSHLKELPRTIGKLQNLQTLDVRFCSFKELPVEVLDIQQLRHLLMRRFINDCEIRVPNKIGKMENLRTLTGVYAGGGIANELSKLTQLRQLEVRRIAEDHSCELFAAIMKMTNLISLTLEAETINVEGEEDQHHQLALYPEMEIFSPPPLLQEVTLIGQLVEIPMWLVSMQNLTKLCLYGSYLSGNMTSEIQHLPNLKHLSLGNASKAKQIGKEFCEIGGFPRLETLKIQSDFLVGWTEIADGAFPSLKSLIFSNCDRFMFFPDGLQKISTLQELCVWSIHEDLERRLQGDENYKIKNIPNVWLLQI